MTTNFISRINESASPSAPDGFIATAKAPVRFNPGSMVLDRNRHKADLVHAHMLRHAAGYKLANDGADTRSLQAYLGHKNIQHTVRYTAMSPQRFRDFWRD
jgi:type 1 fimbriae regulatory protein FimE